MKTTERQPPAEPRLDDWCTEERLRELCQDLLNARESMLWSGSLDQVIQGWVRRQLVNEVFAHDYISLSLEYEPADPCPKDWSSNLYQAWVQQDQALLAWAEYQWGHELESIYLARKSELDRMSLRMLRVSDAGLSMGCITGLELRRPF